MAELMRFILGDGIVARLQKCDELKSEADHQAYRAVVYAWASGKSHLYDANHRPMVDHHIALHDKAAEAFNAIRYWWMPRIELMRQAMEQTND